MREAIPIGKVAGFPVRVHCSVLVILWLFTWSLASTCPTLHLAPHRPVRPRALLHTGSHRQPYL